MKKIFSFICITLMCISLNSCEIYAMSDEYDRSCYHTHNVYYESTPKRCYCNYKPVLNMRGNCNNSKYKPITYRYYTVPIYDPNKPIEPRPKPHIHHHKHHPKQTPHPNSHCQKHHHNHKYKRR